MTFLLKWGDVYPKAPCMEYFAIFYDEFKPNVGKYVMHHMAYGSSAVQFSWVS